MQEEAILLKSPGEEFRYSSSSSHKGEKLSPAENLGLLYIRGTQTEREREQFSQAFKGFPLHAKSLHSCLTLCNPMDCSLPGSSVHGDSPGMNTGVGCHALFQGIFPTQGSNPGLLHCRQTLLSEPLEKL